MEELIEKAFNKSDLFLKKEQWCGREAEVVNLSLQSSLQTKVDLGRLKSMPQVGVEVSVKQISIKTRLEQ